MSDSIGESGSTEEEPESGEETKCAPSKKRHRYQKFGTALLVGTSSAAASQVTQYMLTQIHHILHLIF